MKRVIVDYSKLTNDILSMLVDKFPDGYDESDIIRFRNAQNELVEAVEVRTEDTIFLVKVSKKLATRIENFEEDEELDLDVAVIPPAKGIDLDVDDDTDADEDDQVSDDEDDDEDDEELSPKAARRGRKKVDDDDDDDDE